MERVKRVLFLSIVLMCVPLCAWSAAVVPVQSPKGGASAQPDTGVWDFGVVKAGIILEHTFVMTNDSAKDLVVKDTTTSCGCTASEIKKKLLKPGESTELMVTFDTKGYNGATRQFVYVNTDAIENPVVRFTVKAVVTP
jgi:hypothetical protein